MSPSRGAKKGSRRGPRRKAPQRQTISDGLCCADAASHAAMHKAGDGEGPDPSEARRVAIQLQPAYANPASRHRIQCRKMKGGWSMYARFSLVLVTALCWCGFAIAPAFALDAPACEPAVLAQAASGSAAQSCAIDAAPSILASNSNSGLNSCADSCRRSYESCKRSSKNSKGKGDSCERSFESCARSCGSGKGRV